ARARGPLLGDERRHRRDMIGLERMPHPVQQAKRVSESDGEHDDRVRSTGRERGATHAARPFPSPSPSPFPSPSVSGALSTRARRPPRTPSPSFGLTISTARSGAP